MTSTPVDIGTLIVVILKAKNLPNKRHIGKQDPYCSVKLNDETRRTKAVKRGGQHPEWDEEVRFTIFEDVEDELARTAAGDGTDPPPPPPKKDKKKRSGKKMQLTCYADDPREPDLIGETMVDLTEVLTKGETDEWFPLSNKDKYCGEVYLELTFWSNEKPPEKRITPQASMFHPQYGGPGSFRPSAEVPAVLKHGGSNQNTPSPSRIPSSSVPDVPLPSSLRPSGSLAQINLYKAPYEQHNHHGDHALDQLANGMADLGVSDPSQRRESFPVRAMTKIDVEVEVGLSWMRTHQPVQGAPSEFGFTGPLPSHQRDSFSRMSSGSVSSIHSLGPPSLRGRPPQRIHSNSLSSLPEPFVQDDYPPGPPHPLPPVSETYPPPQPYQYPHAPSGFASPPPSQPPIPRPFASPPPGSHPISSGFAPPQPPSSAMSFHPPQPPSSAMSFHPPQPPSSAMSFHPPQPPSSAMSFHPPQPPSSAMSFHPPQPPSSAMSFHPPQPPSSAMSFHPPQPPPQQYSVPSQTPGQYPPHPQPPASAPPHQYPPSDAPLPPASVPPVSHSAPPQQYAHNGEPSPPHQNYQGMPSSNAYQQMPISQPPPPGSRPLPNPQMRPDHHSAGGFVSPPPGPPPPIAPGNVMFPNAMPFQPPGPPPPPPHRGSLPPTPTKPSVSYPPPPPPPLQNGEHQQQGSHLNTPPRPPLPSSQSYDRHSSSPSPHGSFAQPPHQPQGFSGPWPPPPPPPPPPPSQSSYSGPPPPSNFSTPPPQGQQPYNHGPPPHPPAQFPAGPAWTPPQPHFSQQVSYGSQDGWRQ